MAGYATDAWRRTQRLATDASTPEYVRECALHQGNFNDVRHLWPAELRSLLAKAEASGKPVTLVDVRTPEEAAVSTIPGAVMAKDFGDDTIVNGPLVCFCTVGYRSSLEARRIATTPSVSARCRGGIFSMAGILAWAHEAGELVDPASGKATTRLHCFGSKWEAMAPPSCDTVVFSTPVLGVKLVPVVLKVVREYLRWLLARLYLLPSR